jgi:hypothetical protein
MRVALMLAVLLVVIGCGPKFKDSSEELRYLNSLSNPSVEQFRRREELQKHFRKLASEREERQDAELDKSTLVSIQEATKRARKDEKTLGATSAYVSLKTTLSGLMQYPNEPIYQEAMKELNRLKTLADAETGN